MLLQSSSFSPVLLVSGTADSGTADLQESLKTVVLGLNTQM